MLFIAILILIFLMYRFFTFRAEMVFTMSLIAPIMIVIGACYLPGKYHEAGIFLLVIGAFMLAVVLLICRLTARGVEKGLRLEYYKNLIIYGALKFLQNLSKATIVFSFLAASLGAFSMDYKERLDTKGRKIYVNDNLRDPEGNQYEEVRKVKKDRHESPFSGNRACFFYVIASISKIHSPAFQHQVVSSSSEEIHHRFLFVAFRQTMMTDSLSYSFLLLHYFLFPLTLFLL